MGGVSNWRPSLTLMGRGDVERLHDAATTILETTGLNVHHAQMRRRLLDAGARPGDETRVRLPPEMVEDALRTARRDVVIHNRRGDPVMPLAPHRSYFGTGSDLLYTLDMETGARRPSRVEDVGQAARLCDALEEIDFVMSFALPPEVSSEEIEPRQYHELLRNTEKPIIMTGFSGQRTLERMHAMACHIAGGDAAFRERPNYIMYGQFVSPLQHDEQALTRLVFCAEHEVPLIYVPTIMPGASGPITLAGSLGLAVAECLAGLVMHQLQRPGAPFIFGACVSPLDMRTMLFPYGSPEWRLNDLVMAELARHYGLPVFGTGGATDSKVLDAQAGAECATSLLASALAGTTLIHDVGYMDSGLTGSLESILLGAEQIRWVKKFTAGFQVSAETLTPETVDHVGPGRQFLDSVHTLRHLRQEMWEPYETDRDGYDAWAADGRRDYAQRARERCRRQLDAHTPQPLEKDLDAALAAAMVE